MPFLIPLLPVIAAIGTTAAAGTGIAESIASGNRQNKALNIQDQIAQQEMGDKQKIFDLLQPFFQKYMSSGSPFLSQIQRAGAEQNAQQFNNAAGNVRNTMQTTGLGFGPSGATAAAEGGLSTAAASNASSTYLQNLLNNEQLKFQAAQGLNSLGSMAGSSQNQPNVGINVPGNPIGNTGSSLSALAQILKGLTGSGGGSVGTLPTGLPPGLINLPPSPLPGSTAPTTGGTFPGMGPN